MATITQQGTETAWLASEVADKDQRIAGLEIAPATKEDLLWRWQATSQESMAKMKRRPNHKR